MDNTGTGFDSVGKNAFVFHNATLGYDGHPAVHHLNGAVAAGSLIAVAGPNGSGKSTLLKGLAGLLMPLDGTIDASGAGDTAYMPQTSSLDTSFPATVTDLLILGLWKKRRPFSRLTNRDMDKLNEALTLVDLKGFEKRQIGTLSGGQLQRALFARASLQDARTVLLDEPFTAVDERSVHDLLHLIHHWHSSGKTVVVVLHDLPMVRTHFPVTILMAREVLAWGKTVDVLRDENVRQARHLHEAWDEHAPWCETEPA